MTTLHEHRPPLRPAIPRFVVKQCVCRNCEVMVPETCVVTNYGSATTRTVRAYCEHCDLGYYVEQLFSDGRWQDTAEVKVLSKVAKSQLLLDLAPARREQIRHKVHENRRLDRVIGKRLEEDASQPQPEFDSQL